MGTTGRGFLACVETLGGEDVRGWIVHGVCCFTLSALKETPVGLAGAVVGAASTGGMPSVRGGAVLGLVDCWDWWAHALGRSPCVVAA